MPETQPHPTQRFSILAFALLLGGLPLVWPGLGNLSSDLLPKRIVLYTLACFISILLLWTTKNKYRISSPLLLPATAYVLWNMLSLTWATNPFTGFVEALQLIVFFFLFFAFIHLAIVQHLNTLSQAVTLGGLIASTIGIAQYLGLGFETILSVGLPSSTFIFRNFLAAYLLCAIPFSILVFLNEKKESLALFWFLALCSMLLCLFYTRTRGAWISLAGTIGLTIILIFFFPTLRQTVFQAIAHHWSKPLTRLSMLVCIILLALGATRSANTHKQVIQQFDEKKSTASVAVTSLLTPGSDRGRFAMWNHTLSMIVNHPIKGVGIDNWEYIYPQYDTGEKVTYSSEPVRPHNDILWIASELGLVGLALYIYLLFKAAQIGLRQLKENTNALPTLAALIGLSALIGYSLFSFPKEQPIPALFFWIFLATISSTNMAEAKQNKIIPILSCAICLSAIYLTTRNMTFDIHYQRARAYDQVERIPQAYKEITVALKSGSFDHRAYFLKAHYLQQMGRNKEAIAAYQQALNTHPNYAHSHHNLGGVFAAQKAYPQAIQSYQKALTLRPGYFQAQLHLGNAFAATGQNQQAIEAFQKAVEIYPDFAQAHTNLGALYLRQQNFTSAIESFQKAIKYQPTNAEAYNNLAYAYEQTGNLTNAITAYQNLLKYWKGDLAYRTTVSQHITDLIAQTKER